MEAKLKGIGFPGLRGDIEHDKQTLIDCYTPAVEHAFPSFKMKDVFADQVGRAAGGAEGQTRRRHCVWGQRLYCAD